MSDSVMVWLIIAVLLFWAMGAYNRLIRLRSRAIVAFGALEGLFNRYLSLVQVICTDTGAGSNASDADQAGDTPGDACAGLSAAAQQFNTSLKVAHAKPLSRLRISALKTAYETLCMSWVRLRNLPPDLAGAALPDGLQVQWEQLTVQADAARAEFNGQVVNYNQAIDQFPALMLAWLFGFKPAETI